MKTIKFKYTKADNSVSNRVLVVANEPNKFVSGTDISELDDTEQKGYIQAVKDAKEVYLEMLKQINAEFDVNHNFRQFKPEGMADIVAL